MGRGPGLLVGLVLTVACSVVHGFGNRALSLAPGRVTARRSSRSTPQMIFERFTGEAVTAVMYAQQEATKLGVPELGTEHLLLGVVSSPEGAYAALQRCKVQLQTVDKAVVSMANGAADSADGSSAEKKGGLGDVFGLGSKKEAEGGGDAPFSSAVQKIFRSALVLADDMASSDAEDLASVRSEHLLLALLDYADTVETEAGAAAVFATLEVATSELRQDVLQDATAGTGSAELVGAGANAKGKTPTLEECGEDLTEAAREGKLDPVLGREGEV